MGVAGYLAAKGERDAQFLASQRTRSMIRAEPEEVLALIRAKFQGFYLPHDILDTIVDHFSKQPSEKLSHILLQLEENGEGTQLLRPWVSGVTIAAAYFFGGFIPLLPYLFATVSTAFTISVIITAIVLFTFGCTKSLLAGSCQELRVCLKSGFEMLVLGGLAAAAALTCVKALNQFRNP